jgi:hypothetical protein
MRQLMMFVVVTALALAGTTAIAQTGIFEDFEDGVIDGEWRWSGSDFIEPTGGNPGGYGRCSEIWVPTPVYFGGWDAAGWTGDYQAMGVTGFSIDIMTIATANYNLAYYPLFIAIMNHMGTPDDITDDVFVYYNPDAYNAPAAGTGWASYHWDIPSDFVGAPGELPPGWMGGNWTTQTVFPADMTWQDMMNNVGRLEIRMLYMDYAAAYEPYEMGADNVVLYYENGVVPTRNMSFGSVKSLFH